MNNMAVNSQFLLLRSQNPTETDDRHLCSIIPSLPRGLTQETQNLAWVLGAPAARSKVDPATIPPLDLNKATLADFPSRQLINYSRANAVFSPGSSD